MSASLPVPGNPALAPGAIIGGKYRIDGFLGAGGMGVVLSATHLELSAPVAIKIVRDELAQHEEVVSRLLFEARAAAQMRSAHIVRVLDVARLESGAPYIVMEQLEGLDLAAVLTERGALPPADAVSYLLQTCDGLSEAHGLGIVHRDLKPENLFLANTPEGVVLKILDFGISKNLGTAIRSGARSTLTKKGVTVGSPFYMSPEQMRASPNLDERADVWSLGAILFELLTGHCPFEADSPAELCSKVMVDDTPTLTDFCASSPAGLDSIVKRCLQKEPSERYQSTAELANALREFSVAEQAEAEAETAAQEYALTKPRRFARTLGLLAISAMLVCAGVAFWQLQGRSEWARWSRTGGAGEAARSAGPQIGRTHAPLANTEIAPPSVTSSNSEPIARASAVAQQVPTPAAPAMVPVPTTHYEPPVEPKPNPTTMATRDGVDSRYDL